MKIFYTAALWLLSMVALAGESVWIDVRTADEFNAGHVGVAHHIPHQQIAGNIGKLKLDKEADIYVYCKSGRRAGIARDALLELGYTRVTNVGGLGDALRLKAEMDKKVKAAD
ncbi:rhodanese-like domain-containing protein [Thalassolituus pacificus]|uniref:Rhodanese-like domain-containing protein n=1 Tax=Thalassolituus pacificus TaxID=2975440 RepID=A0A9X3AS90_9GAMM|nr:rhodanese-like domain-containing protein [Thalassolituus pacificus]MCT7359689.1 rhodanese-like domain-containing protein [Thalassolituus pacificus]